VEAAAVVAALDAAFTVAALTVTVTAVFLSSCSCQNCLSVLSAAASVVTRGWFICSGSSFSCCGCWGYSTYSCCYGCYGSCCCDCDNYFGSLIMASSVAALATAA